MTGPDYGSGKVILVPGIVLIAEIKMTARGSTGQKFSVAPCCGPSNRIIRSSGDWRMKFAMIV